jgi:UDP-N-acetylglucosamine 2-epimerase (non-hydrolysing)
MKIISVVGARPNFMKIAPFIKAIEKYNGSLSLNNSGLSHPDNHTEAPGVKTDNDSSEQNIQPVYSGSKRIEHILCHTGQHYDDRMSKAFFASLQIPKADINLGIGSGSHAEQVGNTMIAFEKVLLREKPDWVVVVGDVNATLACSVTAKKLNIKVCHIEAGLRSRDMSMPEEINRLVTDRLSDLLLTPDRISVQNLLDEGVPEEKIQFVGNIMIDTLETNREKAARLNIEDIIMNNLLTDAKFSAESKNNLLDKNNSDKPFAIVTLHRPSNVDIKEVLEPLLSFLTDEVTADMPVIWPVHPRTMKMLQKFDLWGKALSCKNLILLHPLGYHEMLRLNMSAAIMLTDSGGLQEECCVLGTPCLTLRLNTERPVTLKEHGGVSVLTGNSIERIRKEYKIVVNYNRIPVAEDNIAKNNEALRNKSGDDAAKQQNIHAIKAEISNERSEAEAIKLPKTRIENDNDNSPGGDKNYIAKYGEVKYFRNRGVIPELWDGKTAMRCVMAILDADS